MKPVKSLLLAFTFLCFITSCKKESTTTTDSDAVLETTFELTADQATADMFTEDDNDILSEAAEDNQLLGNLVPETLESNNLLMCATVTVTPRTGFPKTILIDFGPTNCVDLNGVARRGRISAVVSDSLRRAGSTSVMTFDHYFVNDFKREGIHTWTNTSTVGTRSWQRKIENGRVTAPGGRYWLHSSVRDVVQTAGAPTPRNLRDDIFSITGHASVTNPGNLTRTATILQALQKKYLCPFIDKGRVKFQGPNHFATLDYGDGACDRFATMSIDGRPPRVITLR